MYNSSAVKQETFQNVLCKARALFSYLSGCVCPLQLGVRRNTLVKRSNKRRRTQMIPRDSMTPSPRTKTKTFIGPWVPPRNCLLQLLPKSLSNLPVCLPGPAHLYLLNLRTTADLEFAQVMNQQICLVQLKGSLKRLSNCKEERNGAKEFGSFGWLLTFRMALEEISRPCNFR